MHIVFCHVNEVVSQCKSRIGGRIAAIEGMEGLRDLRVTHVTRLGVFCL